MERVPQSVAKRLVLKAYLSSDHVSAATAKTIAVVISKNGAAFGNPSGGATNATEIGNGWYYVDLTVTDTGTAGPLVVRGTSASVDDSEFLAVVADAHNAGFDGVPSVAAGASGGLPLAVDASGRVDVLKVNGTSQTARDLGANLDVAVSTRTKPADTQAAVTTVTNLTNAPTAGDLTATMKTSVTTAATAATPAVTVSDKTGFSLSTAGILAIWHQLTAAIVTAASIGKLLVDNIDAAISSRTKPADTLARVTLVDTVTTYTGNTPQTGDSFARIGAAGAGLTALGDARIANLDAAVSSRNATTPPTVAAIRAEMDSNSTKLANLDATVSSRSTYAGGDTAGTTTLLGRLTATRAGLLDNLDAAVSGVAAAVWAVGTRTLTTFGTLVADVATAVWAAATRSLTDKAGFALTAAYDSAKTAAQAGDAMALTSAYDAAKTAGDATVANQTTINNNVLTRLAAGAYTAPDNAGVAAIQAKTDNLPASPAAVSDIPTADANADALLDRTDGIETGWTFRQGLRMFLATLAGKVSGGGTTTVKFRDMADTKDRITATVDGNGNRSAVTRNAT